MPEVPGPVVSGASSRSTTIVIAVLALTVFLTTSNGASLGAFMPDLAADLDSSVPLLGQVTTAVFAVSAIVSLFAGPVADYYGKRRMIQYGLLILAAGALGTALAPTYSWFLGARMLSALSGGFIVGNTLALTGTLYAGEARRATLSWVTAGTASAPIVGVPLLTLVASFSSWRGAYVAVAGASVVALVLLRAAVPDDTAHQASRINLATFAISYRPLLQSQAMLRIYAASALRATSWVGLLTYLGAFLGESLDLSVREIGWAYMIGGAGYFAGTKLAGARLGGLDPRLLYGASTFAMGVLLAIAFTIPTSGIQIALALILAAACSGVGWVMIVTLMSAETPTGQASTMSFNAVLFAVGAALGSFAGGGLIALGGFSAFGIGLVLFATASGCLVWIPVRVRAARLRPGRS